MLVGGVSSYIRLRAGVLLVLSEASAGPGPLVVMVWKGKLLGWSAQWGFTISMYNIRS